jgi:hypothetical protein
MAQVSKRDYIGRGLKFGNWPLASTAPAEHKIEIFLGFDFEICNISLLVMSKFSLIGPVLGEVRFFRVVFRLRGMKKNFELGQKNIFDFFHL